MKNHIDEYKKRLEKGICEYMDMPVSERSSNAIHSMVVCWDDMCKMGKSYGKSAEAHELSAQDLAAWNAAMVNSDGSRGGHWTVDQTTSVASSLGIEFSHISAACWNTAMNMMFSDYGSVASYFGVATADFFGEMAKAFLFDPDGPGPKQKLAAYYENIVKK